MGRLDAESETLIPTFGGGFDVAHTLRADGFDASEDGTGRGTPLVPVGFRVHGEHSTAMTGNGSARVADPVDVTRALDTCGGYATNQGGNVVLQPLAFSCKDHGADASDIAPTLRSMGHDGSHANGGGQVAVAFGWQNSSRQGDSASESVTPTLDKSKTPAVLLNMAVRRLTPTECERLQGFPDGWTDIKPKGKPTPDGPRYKALGNSFAVPVVRWLGERIQMVEDLCNSTSAEDAA